MTITSAANLATRTHTPETAGNITIEQAEQADRTLRENNITTEAWETGLPYPHDNLTRLAEYLTSEEPHEPVHVTRYPDYECECSCGATFTTPNGWGEHYARILLDASYGIYD